MHFFVIKIKIMLINYILRGDRMNNLYKFLTLAIFVASTNLYADNPGDVDENVVTEEEVTAPAESTTEEVVESEVVSTRGKSEDDHQQCEINHR